MVTTVEEKGELIDAAKGQIKADLVLKNGKIVNLYTNEIIEGDLAIKAHKVVGVYDNYDGEKEIDCKGKFILPGFIDGHIHVESSMLSLSEFTKAIVPRGTTSVLIDPHEFANVRGTDALDLFMSNSEPLPLDLFMNVPSCVPATHLETSGAKIDAAAIEELIKHPKIVCLAEMMNFPGVIYKDEEVLRKINAVRAVKKRVDGHCPMLSGKDLNAYLAAGINSDHECSTGEEALEKLRKGMYLMIREGSAAKDMEVLVKFLLEKDVKLHRAFFVSDDKHPHDLIYDGHMDEILRRAVKLGIDPISAIKMVTLNPAKHFGMRGHGSLGIGKVANVAIVDSLTDFNVQMTLYRGEVVAQDGKMQMDLPKDKYDNKTLNSVTLKKDFVGSDFKIDGSGTAKVIVAKNGSLLTEALSVKMEKAAIDISEDILKIAVVERHSGKNNFTVGFVKGFGLKKGAIASTVAHDSHNIVVVGASEKDMAIAVNRLGKINGGIVVSEDENISAELPLPIAGLMSPEPIEKVDTMYAKLHEAAKKLHCKMESPFMTLAFMALPVIPNLKITDLGIVDVNKFDFVDLFD